MTDYFPIFRHIPKGTTSNPLIRLKRTTDDEEFDDKGKGKATSSTKRAADADPMDEALACRLNLAKLKRGYREGPYMELARITFIARGFDRDKKSWARFVKNSFWGKAREQDRPQLDSDRRSKIAFVTRFVFKPHTPNQFKRTSKFSGVLEFLIGEGFKPEDMFGELKKRRIEKIHKLVTKKPRASGRKNDKPADPIDIVETRHAGEHRSSQKSRGPIFRWDKKARKAMKKHNRVSARVRLDCKVMEPEEGRICLSVVGVTGRK